MCEKENMLQTFKKYIAVADDTTWDLGEHCHVAQTLEIP